MQITASMLYNLTACPQRVALDRFGDASEKDAISPFVQLLWERGSAFEAETIANLNAPFLDLSHLQDEAKERATLDAMRRGEPLIYSGRISSGELLGIPDLLRKEGPGYVPGDINLVQARKAETMSPKESQSWLTPSNWRSTSMCLSD